MSTTVVNVVPETFPVPIALAGAPQALAKSSVSVTWRTPVAEGLPICSRRVLPSNRSVASQAPVNASPGQRVADGLEGELDILGR